MIHVLVHHEVNDYRSWRSVFDAAIDFRHLGGEQSCRVFRKSGDPNNLTLLFEWEDLEQAGVIGTPEIQYLAEMYTVRRSAAD